MSTHHEIRESKKREQNTPLPNQSDWTYAEMKGLPVAKIIDLLRIHTKGYSKDI